MRLRKISRFLLALILILGVCVPAARAAEAPEVSISSGTVAPGGDVTLTVSIRNNPGIVCTAIHFYYDTSLFSADPEGDIRAVGDFRSGVVVGNDVATARANGYSDCPPDKNGVLCAWFDSSGSNV